MNTILIKIFLVLFIGYVVNNQDSCPLSSRDNSILLTASIQILPSMQQNGKLPQSQVSYVYALNQVIPKNTQVALSISQIEADPSKSLKLGVRRPYINSTGLYFIFENSDPLTWKSHRIAFLLTNRNDIEIGSAEVICQQPTSDLIMNYRIANPDMVTHRLKVKPFVREIDLRTQGESQTITLRFINFFTQKDPLTQTGEVKLYFSSKSFVRYLGVSLVIFNPQNENFGYLQGSNSQNYINSILSLQVSPLKATQQRVSLVGLQSFDFDGHRSIAVFSHINDGYRLQFGSLQEKCKVNFLQVSYLVLSVYQCGNCKGRPFLYQSQCLRNCPKGFKPVKGKCQELKCTKGFYQLNNRCRKCPERSDIPECDNACDAGTVLVEGQCVCTKEYFNHSNTCCKCPNSSVFSSISHTCQIQCQKYQRFVNGKCQCQPLMVRRQNNQCKYCPIHTYYNNGQCTDKCDSNQRFLINWCVCAPGYHMINGVCGKCNQNSQSWYDAENQKCLSTCPAQSQRNNSVCHKKCSKDQIFHDQSKGCLCGQSYQLGSESFCKNGYKLINGLCARCCNGYFFDPSNNICHLNCQVDQIYNPSTLQCQCIRGSKVNGKCMQSCPEGIESIDGICQKKCTQPNAKYNPLNGKCECIQGTSLKNGHCVACSSCLDNSTVC